MALLVLLVLGLSAALGALVWFTPSLKAKALALLATLQGVWATVSGVVSGLWAKVKGLFGSPPAA